MQNRQIIKIYEAFTENDVNLHLELGWVIIAVVSGDRFDPNEGKELGPVYVMGLPFNPEED